MVKLDLSKLLFDRRITKAELAESSGVKYPALVKMVRRGTVKIDILRKLETVLGDLKDYIIN